MGARQVLVQDWFKNAQTRFAVRDEMGRVLDLNLPESFDRTLFAEKRDRVFELAVDLAMNNERWAA